MRAVAVFDTGNMGGCPGRHRGGGAASQASVPWRHASVYWGWHRHWSVFWCPFAGPRAPNRLGPPLFVMHVWDVWHVGSKTAARWFDLNLSFCCFSGIDYKTTTILLDGRRVKLQLWYEHAVVHTAAYVSCYQSVWKESRGQPKYTGGMWGPFTQ